MWHCQHPEFFSELDFFPSQVQGKGPKDSECTPKNTVYRMSENLGFPFPVRDSETKGRSRVMDCTVARVRADPTASPEGTHACKAVAKWPRSLTWSPWQLLGAHPLSHPGKNTRIPLLTFRTPQAQDSEHMLLCNYLIFLRSGDNLPTSRKTGLAPFEVLLLGQGKQTPWLFWKL